MKTNAKKIWMAAGFLLGILVAGGYLARRPCSVDRTMASAPIRYAEMAPIVPTFGKLSALAIAPDGQLYVAGENAIGIFPGTNVFPMVGTPGCMAVDGEGTIFVGMRDHVEVYSGDWKKTVWPPPGAKARLTSMAVDEWYLYVADAGNRRIWRYGKAGGNPREIGKKDWFAGVRGFSLPDGFFDVDLAGNGSLWAANPGRLALENYRPDGMPISSWEKAGGTLSHFALMPDGAFAVVEEQACIRIRRSDGSLRCGVSAPGRFEGGGMELDLAVDESGRIHVLDPFRGQVRVFEKKR